MLNGAFTVRTISPGLRCFRGISWRTPSWRRRTHDSAYTNFWTCLKFSLPPRQLFISGTQPYLHLHYSALTMDAARSSKLLIPIYKATWRHIPEASSLHHRHCSNLKWKLCSLSALCHMCVGPAMPPAGVTLHWPTSRIWELRLRTSRGLKAFSMSYLVLWFFISIFSFRHIVKYRGCKGRPLVSPTWVRTLPCLICSKS